MERREPAVEDPQPPGPSAGDVGQVRALPHHTPALEFDPPNLGGGQLRRLSLADIPGGRRRQYDVLSSNQSDRVCIFIRSLQRAIYGEVWDAVEVELVEAEGEPQWFRVLKHDDGRDKHLAVKRMPWDSINRLRERLQEDPLREIAALELLSSPGHPNVLPRVEALDDGGTVYLLTPFIGGGELFTWIADDGGAEEEVVRPIFRQIVDGMRYMHHKGVCHADMSLENCLVDRARRNAFIIDFGMCLLVPRDAEGRRYMSTPDRRRAKPSYCSPEAFKGRAYDGVKVDVFAAGAMLFMMLTGIPPFSNATRHDPAFKKLVWFGDVQGLLQAYNVPPLAEEAADLIKNMMAYDHRNRPLPEQVLRHPWLAPPAGG